MTTLYHLSLVASLEEYDVVHCSSEQNSSRPPYDDILSW